MHNTVVNYCSVNYSWGWGEETYVAYILHSESIHMVIVLLKHKTSLPDFVIAGRFSSCCLLAASSFFFR